MGKRKVPIRPCKRDDCPYDAMKGRPYCGWHTLEIASLPQQEAAAAARLQTAQQRPGFVHRSRLAASLVADEGHFCPGCQSVVPKFYVRGSRCLACNRRQARESHVERTYELTADELRWLNEWQGGRCFICGREVVTRNLAVDHDHKTNAVRGLLCSDNNWGCNVTLRRLLDDPAAAARLVAYIDEPPLERMRRGAAPWKYKVDVDLGPPPF